MKARLPAPDSRLRQSLLLRLLAATARDEECVDRAGTGRSSRYEAGVRFLSRSGQDAARLVLRRGPA